MKGRGNGREDPWLLIKERDALARPGRRVQRGRRTPRQRAAPGRSARTGCNADRRRPAAGAPAGARARRQARCRPRCRMTCSPSWPCWSTRRRPTPPAGSSRSSSTATACWRGSQSGRVRLVTRNGNDWTARLPALVAALQAMDLPDGWYDGEIIMPGRDTPADFQALQGAFDTATHRRDRLLPVRPAVLRRAGPARRAAGAAARGAAAHRRCASRTPTCASARSSRQRRRICWHPPASSASKA